MPFAARTEEDYYQAILSMFPQHAPAWHDFVPGGAWDGLLRVIAREMLVVHERYAQFERELLPQSTNQMVPEWYIDYGLPEPCATPPASLQEQRNSILEKKRRRGGHSAADIVEAARLAGYEITVTDGVTPGSIVVKGARIYYTEFDTSDQVDDPLARWNTQWIRCVIENTVAAGITIDYQFTGEPAPVEGGG